LRVKSIETCRLCKEKYCISGSEKGYACPVFEYPGTMERNNNCILCTECIKTCHRNNISFNLRNFAADLVNPAKRMDEAFFVLILLGITVFQTLSMTRPWAGLAGSIMMYTGAGYDAVRLFLFIALALLPVLVYSIATAVSKMLTGMGYKDIFTGFAYSIIPVGLSMFLAHNMRHLLEEGMGLIPAISDPLGSGLDLLGTSGYMPSPIMSTGSILLLQWLLMLIGLGASYSAGRNISKRMQKEPASIPVLIFNLLFFAFALWLLGQPIMHKH